MGNTKSQIDRNTEIAEVLHAQKESIGILLKRNERLQERLIEKSTRISLCLTMCDDNERNYDYSCSTDSVRAILTDYPVKEVINKLGLKL